MTKATRKQEYDKFAMLEPRLIGIEQNVKSFARRVKKLKTKDSVFCATRWWYGYGEAQSGIRAEVCRLVGWNRKPKDELSTNHAYDIVYDHLYESLPDCQHEDMCWSFKDDVGIEAL